MQSLEIPAVVRARAETVVLAQTSQLQSINQSINQMVRVYGCMTSWAQTQARASDDYHPGQNQWIMSVTSIFAHAIGIAPTKDNYW